jgi:hypothetical protein
MESVELLKWASYQSWNQFHGISRAAKMGLIVPELEPVHGMIRAAEMGLVPELEPVVSWYD